jgi:rod shape-determining protein MreC
LYRQQVRRRRAVLALVVALSLITLTAYFGESAGGGLHSLQRGALSVLAPIQEGANRALKPLSDLFGWFGDTLDAKKERKQLVKERDQLRREVLLSEGAVRENEQLRALLGLSRQPELSAYQPVTARVIGRSPTIWYSTINIDKGSSAGVRVDQPVITGEGLIGKVTAVTRGAAQVTLITDRSSGVSAMVVSPNVDRGGIRGVVQTAVGNPDDLRLEFVPRSGALRRGDRVVTAGSRSTKLESLFPPGIPIGTITRIDDEELDLYQRVHIKPFADLRRVDFVQVLVARGGATSTDRAQVP